MKIRISSFMVLLSIIALLAGCAGGPKPIEGLESSSKLQASAEFPAALVYKKDGIDGKKYVKFLFDPVEIYSGADAQFNNVSEADKKILADFIKSEFTRVIQGKYAIVDKAGPDVLRIKFTLAGIEMTKPALATMTRVTPVGLALNLGKSAAGMSGSFMGSVTLSGEFYDSGTNSLVFAFLTKRGPNAMDVTTMMTGLDAAKKAITEIADKFRENIDMIQNKK
jgi:hypothetical protein